MKWFWIVLGLHRFCPWCTTSREQRRDLQPQPDSKSRTLSDVVEMSVSGAFVGGHKSVTVFDCVPSERYILDELHSLLRVFDKLLTLLIKELTNHAMEKRLERQSTSMQKPLQDALDEIGIKFKYIDKKGEISWTCLSRRYSLKCLEHLDFSNIFAESSTRGAAYSDLWRGFVHIFRTYTRDFEHTKKQRREVARKLEAEMRKWLNVFLRPFSGVPGTQSYVEGLYSATDVTWYLHSLLAHMPAFVKKYGRLRQFSCSSHEAENGVHTAVFLSSKY